MGLKSRLKQKIKAKAESEEKLVQRLPKSVSAKLGLNKAQQTVATPTTAQDSPNANVATQKSSGTGDAAPAPAPAQVPGPGPAPDSTETAIKGEPRVLHGHTLTKGASFREIAYAIRDSAFVTSDLPVIISFEVHASLEQQQIMVDIIHEAWKGYLVELPADTPADKLPSLAQLKRKILIKTKSLPLKGTKEIDEEVEEEEELQPEGTPEDKLGSPNQKPAKPIKILEALAKLAVYTRAYHFSRFDQPGM